jgi:hypothetical protein
MPEFLNRLPGYINKVYDILDLIVVRTALFGAGGTRRILSLQASPIADRICPKWPIPP